MKKLIFVTLLLSAPALGCNFGDTLKNFSQGPTSNANSASANTGTTANSGITADSDSKPKKKTAATGNPREDIVNASKMFLQLDSFSAQMDGTGTNEMHAKLEFVAPDSYRISNNVGGRNIETVIVGKDTYVKVGTSWRKVPVDVGSMIPNLREAFTEEGLKTLNDVNYEAEDTVDGKPALRYSYANVTPKEKTAYTSKLWISSDTGLPLKIVVDYESGPLKQMTVKYDTETKITIERPAK